MKRIDTMGAALMLNIETQVAAQKNIKGRPFTSEQIAPRTKSGKAWVN